VKVRIGAAVLLAALIPLTGVTTPAPARAGEVDITPPAVGSCHDISSGEVADVSDPDPAVDCALRHQSVTVAVVELQDPDWSDGDAVWAAAATPCARASLALFENQAKALQMSAYTRLYFFPTKAQRDAGASWVRCDVALLAATYPKPLPTDGDPVLGPLPLADNVARCRGTKGNEYVVVMCKHAHAFRATHAVKYAGDSYPGQHRMIRWTIRRCSDKLGRSFGFYEAAPREKWRAGLRYSICFKKTSN